MRTRSNNTMLTAVLLVLTLNLIVGLVPGGSAGISHANAAANVTAPIDPPAPSFPNNAEILRRQSDSLADIAARLGRIEAKLDKPMQVKVIEMPVMPKSDSSGAQAAAPAAPASSVIVKPAPNNP